MDSILRRNSALDLAQKTQNGLLFGVIAGFWIAVSLWGWDALLLSQANCDLPWLKFALGTPIIILLAAAAGWLTARLDNSVWGALIWLLVGILAVLIAGHIPFEGQSLIIGLIDPEFSGLQIYPFVESIRLRMRLLFVIIGLLSAIGGALELLFVEAASNSNSHLISLSRLSFCLIIFIPIGIIIDNLIGSDLRLPVQGMDELIQFGVEVKKGDTSKEEQREMGVRALLPFGDQIQFPYRLILGYYNAENLEDTIIFADFSGDWGSCSLIRGRPFVCWRSADRYLNPLACILKTGSDSSCRLKLSPALGESSLNNLLVLDAVPLKFGILGQRGTAVLAIVEDREGDQVTCVLRDTGDVILERCQKSEPRDFDSLTFSNTPSPKPTAVPTQTSDSPEAHPASFDSRFEGVLIQPANFDVAMLEGASKYHINLKIAPNLRSFEGKARIDFTNQEDVQLDELFFRLLPNGNGSYGNGSLEIVAIIVNGEYLKGEFSGQETVLRVGLSEVLLTGDQVRVEIDFSGEVPEDFGGSVSPAGYGIFNLTEGVLALSGWYPILAVYDEQGWNLDEPSSIGDSVYSDMALYSVDVSLPGDQIIAATGVMTVEQKKNGVSQYHFESGPSRDFFIVVSSDFKQISRSVNGTIVHVYTKPEDSLSGEQALEAAAASLAIYNEKFGDYPYIELDIVAAPMRNALGVEFPGIVLVGQDLFAHPEKPEFEITIAHEVAHQWWYGLVGNDVFDEPWLDEALATYSSSLYYEYGINPNSAFGLIDYWKQRYSRLSAEIGDDLVTADLHHFESLNNPSIYSGIVYVKGALFFDALRTELGDQAFFEGLQLYFMQNAFKIARTDDLLDSFESASGRQLDAIYQKWLFTEQ